MGMFHRMGIISLKNKGEIHMKNLLKSFFVFGIAISMVGIINTSAKAGYYGHNTKVTGTVGVAESDCSKNSSGYMKIYAYYTLNNSRGGGTVRIEDNLGNKKASVSGVFGQKKFCTWGYYGDMYGHQHSYADSLMY